MGKGTAESRSQGFLGKRKDGVWEEVASLGRFHDSYEDPPPQKHVLGHFTALFIFLHSNLALGLG